MSPYINVGFLCTDPPSFARLAYERVTAGKPASEPSTREGWLAKFALFNKLAGPRELSRHPFSQSFRRP
jgi:hypothetical protein